MFRQSTMNLRGEVRMKVARCPKAPLAWRIQNFLLHRLPDLPRLALARLANVGGVPILISALYIKVQKADGQWIDYGLVSTRVVTTTGVGFIVDAFQNLVELENMKFHGIGTGVNAEAAANTTLQTEITTEYTVNNTRPTGTTTEGASANIYRTVATIQVDGTVANTEHGVFDQAATGGGVMLDRSVYSVINLGAGDAITATYELTFASGG